MLEIVSDIRKDYISRSCKENDIQSKNTRVRAEYEKCIDLLPNKAFLALPAYHRQDGSFCSIFDLNRWVRGSFDNCCNS